MAEAAYAIGRGKPPLHTRFQKGQSGNPSGKPGPAKLAKERFARALFAELERDPADLERAPPPENGIAAVARRMTLDAIQGRTAAQRLVLSLLDRAVGEQEAAERAAAEENMPYLDDLLWPDPAVRAEIFGSPPPPAKRTQAETVSLVQGKKQGKNSSPALGPPPRAANRPPPRVASVPPPPPAKKPPPLSLLQGKKQGKEKFPGSRAQLLAGAAVFASG